MADAGSDAWDPAAYDRDARFVSEYGVELLELLQPSPKERILDVGCGDGYLTARIAARGAKVVGIDSSPALAEAARRRGIDVRTERVEELSFGPSFDAVFSNAALHWVPSAGAALANIRRALKPGGRLVVEQGGDENVNTIRKALIRELRDSQGIQTDLADIWYFPTAFDHARLLAECGFRLRFMLRFLRPTAVDDMEKWLRTLSAPVLRLLPGSERDGFVQRVARSLRPKLQRNDGKWNIDYVRLRYLASAAF